MSSSVTTLMGPGLILLIMLAYRVISAIELWLIMRFLPRPDRVTAAVAFVTARSVQASSSGDKSPIAVAGQRDTTTSAITSSSGFNDDTGLSDRDMASGPSRLR